MAEASAYALDGVLCMSVCRIELVRCWLQPIRAFLYNIALVSFDAGQRGWDCAQPVHRHRLQTAPTHAVSACCVRMLLQCLTAAFVRIAGHDRVLLHPFHCWLLCVVVCDVIRCVTAHLPCSDVYASQGMHPGCASKCRLPAAASGSKLLFPASSSSSCYPLSHSINAIGPLFPTCIVALEGNGCRHVHCQRTDCVGSTSCCAVVPGGG
jgi:hypothetical protein